jgi:hypothetical protein
MAGDKTFEIEVQIGRRVSIALNKLLQTTRETTVALRG